MDGTFDSTHDVVVVGSGAGAMAAALTAARAGLDTVVLEKTPLLGGTSAYSGAAAWLPGNVVRQRDGSGDSVESGRAYLTALLGDSEAERREAFLTSAGPLIDDLTSDPAVAFDVQPFPDYYDVPGRVPGGRSILPAALPLEEIGPELAALVRPSIDRDRAGLGHVEGEPFIAGRALIGRLLLGLTRAGGRVHVQHEITEILVEDGRVSGVVVETVDGQRRIGARRGVILAGGGFERNQQMREEFGVPGGAQWAMAPAGSNTGGPLRAAMAIGGATDLMDEGWWCPALATPDGGGAFFLGIRGGIVVDASGRRFANESLPYDRMGRELAAAPGRQPGWFVFDSREGDIPAMSMPPFTPQEHLAAGTWVQADTLAELAATIGVPADALGETVERFNTFAHSGHDEEFGRGSDEYDLAFAAGQGPNAALVPLEQGPFFAARLMVGDLGTKGGLRTDVDARVLREDGSVIEGLHATGNCAASLSGHFYPGPGVPIGTAMVFGWRAARALAGESSPAGVAATAATA